MASSGNDTRDGLVLGLIAYASVALFYALFDLVAARGSLYTVNLLGLAVFRGVRDAAVLQFPLPVDRTAVFLYNGLHLVLSLAIGWVVVWLVGVAERDRGRAWPIFLLIVAGYFATVVAVGVLSEPIRVVLPWWSIAVANASAVVLGSWWLSRRRPGVIARVVPF